MHDAVAGYVDFEDIDIHPPQLFQFFLRAVMGVPYLDEVAVAVNGFFAEEIAVLERAITLH
ncbi:hypothetical protein [Rhizobium phaseoli]|uniref:hypothetical protein n=1 Tax=Rhizobium phaseoli TaxID=396 RepID=UPI0009BEF016|nr:hypothetical protein [Rhizobium phaseoli]PDS73969.1 hypothetical protein CO651_03730 [Rhizobium phaseoli]